LGCRFRRAGNVDFSITDSPPSPPGELAASVSGEPCRLTSPRDAESRHSDT